jgi:hypothetical protein
MDDFGALLEQAQSVVALLGGAEQVDARRALDLFSGVSARAREGGKLVPDAGDLALRRELGHLVELLSRRSSTAIVLATLGRAVLADLAGDVKSAQSLRREFESKFAVLGL